MEYKIRRARLALISKDLEATREFYVSALGFEVMFEIRDDSGSLVIVSLDGKDVAVTFKLAKTGLDLSLARFCVTEFFDAPALPLTCDVYLVVDQLRDLENNILEKAASAIIARPNYDAHSIELVISDNNGYYISFTESY